MNNSQIVAMYQGQMASYWAAYAQGGDMAWAHKQSALNSEAALRNWRIANNYWGK
jgi:hypothetical protein